MELSKEDDRFLITFSNGIKKRFEKKNNKTRLVSQVDRYGNGLSLEYENGLLVSIKASNNRRVTIKRNKYGRIISVSDEQNRTASYHYDKQGGLASVTDIGGYNWHYRYTDSGQLAAIINPEGTASLLATYHFTGDSEGKVASIKIGPHINNYSYEGSATFINLENIDAIKIDHTSTGIVTKVTRQDGAVSENRIGEENRIESITTSNQGHFQYEYLENGNLNSITQENQEGITTLTYYYNEKQQLQQVTSEYNNLLLEYDSNDRLVLQDDDGVITELGYNNKGDLISKTEKGYKISYGYNDDGQITRVENSDGLSQFTYFNNGKLKQVTFPDGKTHKYQYNALGLRIETIRSNGQKIQYEYDTIGNLIGLQESFPGEDVKKSKILLDEHFRTIGLIVNGKNVLTVHYNSRNLVSKVVHGAEETHFEYDDWKRLTKLENSSHGYVYQYKINERDIATRLDDRTPLIVTSPYLNNNSINSVLYTREQTNKRGLLVFYSESLSFGLPSPWGIELPEIGINSANHRRRLYNLTSQEMAQLNFDKPSSSFFIPAEYYSINCRPGPICALPISSTLLGPATVNEGDVAIFTNAMTYQQYTCGFFEMQWRLNGTLIESQSLSKFDTTTASREITFSDVGNGKVVTTVFCYDCYAGYQVEIATVCVNPSSSTTYEKLINNCPDRSQNSRAHEIDGCTWSPDNLESWDNLPAAINYDKYVTNVIWGSVLGQVTPQMAASQTLACNIHDIEYQTCLSNKSSADQDLGTRVSAACRTGYPVACPYQTASDCNEYFYEYNSCTEIGPYYKAGTETSMGRQSYKNRQLQYCKCC
ncbi:hypothetical protein GCM10009092_11170 [Bowmanella denitrificans]|uniref:Teneurin-like YD-shell domain-containing protein n=2 Tax=Bowmanella denitrificans TaxID=366582 RepID=A0ABP3GQ93_9ALTE